MVYPGTHDNDPINSWFASLSADMQQLVRTYFGQEALDANRMHEVFVRAAMMCRAETCVIQIQDHLGLGAEARINDPAHQEGNWHWRLKPGMLTDELAQQIFEETRRYGRLNWDSEVVRQRMQA